MILVADSGSTKCDWVIIDGDLKFSTNTMGFNPFFHSAELVHSKIKENETLSSYKDQIKEIFFYGAGCSNSERNSVIEKALSSFFVNQNRMIVEEDLNGAAYATCRDQQGIVCILGTGSNACYFDGENIRKGLPALGYVLGDEGSGAYFGKVFISSYLYGKLPQELEIAFQEYSNQSVESLFSAIYNKPNANVFLASFMKFISEHKEHPYIKQMLYKGLKHFAEIHILYHPEHKTTPVHFVGSVAHFFQDQLIDLSLELGFKIGEIIRKPITALADYHTNLIELDTNQKINS